MTRAQDDVTCYDSTRRVPPTFEEVLQVVRYRDLVKHLIRRDVLTRYKRSILGLAWTMLNPLGMMVVITVAFSNLFKTTQAFPLYLLTGLVAWTFFSQTTTSAMTQLTWGGALLNRIYVPRTIFAVSSVGTGLVNLLFSLVPLALVMVLTSTPLRPPIVVLPFAIILLACFALGVGLLLSTVGVYFPDFVEMYQVMLLAWMYLTPIIYPPEIVPPAYQAWIFTWNPMHYLVRLFRLPVYYGAWPDSADLAIAVALSLGMLLVGWTVFTRRADEFAYRV